MTNSFDTSKKWAPLLGKVLILGLGKSGQAASEYCANLLGSRVTSLTVAAGKCSDESQAFAQNLTKAGVRVAFDTFDFAESYDLCIASPGISEFSDFYQHAKAHAHEVISEVEFAWRESDINAKWIAISGTNGKTTTTALTAHLLQTCGLKAHAVGNIGDTCLEAVALGDTEYYVAEVSSYQLASTSRFAPDVAVLLNITPDHIKWHKSFESYCQAKKKIFAHCTSRQTVVLDATNDIVREYVRDFRARSTQDTPLVIPLGTADGIYSSMVERCGHDNAAYCDGGWLTVVQKGTTHRFVQADSLQIKGEHNIINALAATVAAFALGADKSSLACGLTSFAPLEHRIEPCGIIEGVRCYNDSKATNVDATLKALAAFGEERPCVLLGGDDKGTDLSELVDQAEKHCKSVVCFGAAGPRFYEAFRHAKLPVYRAQTLESAFDEALAHTESGDIVILSPACASFDEFSCFEERGEVFKALVASRSKERGA